MKLIYVNKLSIEGYSFILFFLIIQGSPLTWIIPWVRLSSGPLHPGELKPGLGTRPNTQYRIWWQDGQFSSAWRRTRKHDNWPPRSLPNELPPPVRLFFYFASSLIIKGCDCLNLLDTSHMTINLVAWLVFVLEINMFWFLQKNFDSVRFTLPIFLFLKTRWKLAFSV